MFWIHQPTTQRTHSLIWLFERCRFLRREKLMDVCRCVSCSIECMSAMVRRALGKFSSIYLYKLSESNTRLFYGSEKYQNYNNNK